VNAAFIYDHIKSRVIQSGVLLQEIAETIAKQTQEEDGELRLQLCALIFLIGQLPHGGPNDASEFRVLAFLGGDEVGIISSYLTSS